MKTTLVTSYVFTPANRTLDLSSISGFSVRRLYAVINTTADQIIYATGVSGSGYSGLTGSVLTLQYNTTAMSSTDDLMVIYDDPSALSTAPTASENHIGEFGGNSAVVSASFTRPANTIAYTSGQLVSNSTIPGSVTPLTLSMARKMAGTGKISRVRLSTSSTSIVNAVFRVHLYRSTPTLTNGDGGVWLSTESNYIGSFDVTLDKAFSDAAKGVGSPTVGSSLIFDTAAGSTNLYALIEARAAYTPTSGETFTLTIEAERN